MNGIFIPDEIKTLKTINLAEKVLLSIYWYYTNGKLKCCKKTNEDIYNELMVSKNTFHRMKTHLKELGYIRTDGGIRVYYLGVENKITESDTEEQITEEVVEPVIDEVEEPTETDIEPVEEEVETIEEMVEEPQETINVPKNMAEFKKAIENKDEKAVDKALETFAINEKTGVIDINKAISIVTNNAINEAIDCIINNKDFDTDMSKYDIAGRKVVKDE